MKELPVTEFESKYGNLLNEINSKDSKYAFSVESTQNCVDRILCYKILTPSMDKNDMMIKIIDADTVYSPTIGSSMKFELGSYPTLLNAGKTTNFIYKIIKENGTLEYRKMNNQIFEDNLVLIDSNMDKIIAETLLYFYKDGIRNCN